MEKLLDPFKKKVRGFYGSQGGGTLPPDTDLAVCTIEKANILMNKLMEESRLSEVGIIVIDELHMVGDEDRGYLLELLLTKLRYAAGLGAPPAPPGSAASSPDSTTTPSRSQEDVGGLQIVGMSATMPNVEAVASWLGAALYKTDFRPVPLEEFVKVDNIIYDNTMRPMRTLPVGSSRNGIDKDHLVVLCEEVVRDGHSVLIFCASRQACQNTAKHLAKLMPRRPTNAAEEGKDPSMALDELRRTPGGLDPTLAETVPCGVAYHHAGLTVEEREIVEGYFKKGAINILTATSTLAAGVNLPARRVIFRSPRIGIDFLDGVRYRQMAGRAGRTGIDTKGESVLICSQLEQGKVQALLREGCLPLESCLREDKRGMTRALLEVVAAGVVQTPTDVQRYVHCTLLKATIGYQQVVASAQAALRWLCEQKCTAWDPATQTYSATPLGRASFGSGLTPEEALLVFEDLARAREGFVLSTELHTIFLVTPIYTDLRPDWKSMYSVFQRLTPAEQKVGGHVGVTEPFLMRLALGGYQPRATRNRQTAIDQKPAGQGSPQRKAHDDTNAEPSPEEQARIASRFFAAIALTRLAEEVPVSDVAAQYSVPKGGLQALQEAAGRFASLITTFCERLGWTDLQDLIKRFQNRVSFGVRAECVELTAIPHVRAFRARALFKAGLRTAQSVASASVEEITRALLASLPGGGAPSVPQKRIQGMMARKIQKGAKELVLERANEIRAEAFSNLRALGVVVSDAEMAPVSKTVLESPSVRPPDPPNPAPQLAKSPAIPLPSPLLPSSSSHLNKPQTRLSDQKRSALDTIAEREGQERMNSESSTESASIGALTQPDDGALGRAGGGARGASRFQREGGQVAGTGLISAHVSGSTRAVEREGNALLCSAAAFQGQAIVAAVLPAPCAPQQNAPPGGSQGPVDVDKMKGGFAAFLQMWNRVMEFVFDMHITGHQAAIRSGGPFELEGMAVCWRESPVYYVPIARAKRKGRTPMRRRAAGSQASVAEGTAPSKSAPDADAEDSRLLAVLERWTKVNQVLEKEGVTKIGWDLKEQLWALGAACFKRPTSKFGSPSRTQQLAQVAAMRLQACGLTNQQPARERIPLEEIMPPDPLVDVKVAAWMLDPDRESSRKTSVTLETLVKERLPPAQSSRAARLGRWSDEASINKSHTRAAHNGCCRRAAQTLELWHWLHNKLQAEGLMSPLVKLEVPLARVLKDMERSGITINLDLCREHREPLVNKLKWLEVKAASLAGTSFSLTSPQEVASILFDRLKLPPPPGASKTKHHISTDKSALDALSTLHPVVPVIKEHRTLAKLLHSTIDLLITAARPAHEQASGGPGAEAHKIYGRWLQTAAATGRLAMEEPSLQCIQHSISFPSEGAVEVPAAPVMEVNVREVFVPSQQGWVLLSADYSQIEVRMLAHFSGDPVLVQLLSTPGSDLFRLIAAQWRGVTEKEITGKQRDAAKHLTYGILYGMGVELLADKLGCSDEEARSYRTAFLAAFPGVTEWIKRTQDDCSKKGYIETLCGRRRYLEKINDSRGREKARAERQAVNSICQGSAADLTKVAMLRIHSLLTGSNSRDSDCVTPAKERNGGALAGASHLLLQIHDELLFEVREDKLAEVAAMVRRSMEGALQLRVPLQVKLKAGPSWGHLQLFDERRQPQMQCKY